MTSNTEGTDLPYQSMVSTFWKWIEQSQKHFLVWMNFLVLHLTECLKKKKKKKKHKRKRNVKEIDEMKTAMTL